VKLCAISFLIMTSAGMFCGFACAEEGGSGHYQPGTTASFIDMLPDRGTSTLVYANAFLYYHGSAGASRGKEDSHERSSGGNSAGPTWGA